MQRVPPRHFDLVHIPMRTSAFADEIRARTSEVLPVVCADVHDVAALEALVRRMQTPKP